MLITRKSRPILFCFTLQLCFASLGLAQILPFEYYSTPEGLPSQWITTIYEDRRGHLWIGSVEGVSVYDGMSFKNYSLADGLPVSHVWSIIESKSQPGTMWIGTHMEGVVKFTEGKFTAPLKFGATPATNVVGALLEDHEGVLWCGTLRGMYKVRDGHAAFVSTGNDSGYVRFIAQTRDSTVWFGLDRDVYRYFPRSGKIEPMNFPMTEMPMRAMIESTDGTLWLGTERGELWQWRDGRIVARRSLAVGELHNLLLDYDGSLWIISKTGVLNVPTQGFPRGAVVHYSSKNGLPRHEVVSCLLDREHNLWLGTQGNGLAKLANRNILRFPLPGLRADVMNRAVMSDARGRLFVVSEQGLWEIWRRSDGSWQQHLHRLQHLPGPMWQADFGPDSTLWIAMRQGGLCGYRLAPQGENASRLVLRRMLKPGRDLPAGFPLAFIVDRRHQLWCNIHNLGLAHIDLNTGKMRKLYTANDGLPAFSLRVCQSPPRSVAV